MLANNWDPISTGPMLYRYPGGDPVTWDEQKNGDLIVHLVRDKWRLTGIEVWKIVEEGDVFLPPKPSGYRPVNAVDMYALLPSWQPDKHVDCLTAFLNLRTFMRQQTDGDLWGELSAMIGRRQPLSPEAQEFLKQKAESAGWQYIPASERDGG